MNKELSNLRVYRGLSLSRLSNDGLIIDKIDYHYHHIYRYDNDNRYLIINQEVAE